MTQQQQQQQQVDELTKEVARRSKQDAHHETALTDMGTAHDRTMSLLATFEDKMNRPWDSVMRSMQDMEEKIRGVVAGQASLSGTLEEIAAKSTDEQHRHLVGMLERQTTNLELLQSEHRVQATMMAQIQQGLEDSQAEAAMAKSRVED